MKRCKDCKHWRYYYHRYGFVCWTEECAITGRSHNLGYGMEPCKHYSRKFWKLWRPK